MAVYAIGDIQGCYAEFQQLLEKVKFNADTDQLWLTGDVVNRGPESLATLRLVYAMRDNIRMVLGNHDLHLLATAYDNKPPGRHDTLDNVLQATDCYQLLDWLRKQPLLHYDAEHKLALVHAGIHPHWDLVTAARLANEVETLLRSDQHAQFYKHMYGDKPTAWSETLTSWPRYRFITNMFTRMRFLDAKARATMNPKGAPGSQPAGYVPWFELPRASADVIIIFGHWSSLPASANYDQYNVYPIDSGCLWGGQLTAIRIDTTPVQWLRLNCQQSHDPAKHQA